MGLPGKYGAMITVCWQRYSRKVLLDHLLMDFTTLKGTHSRYSKVAPMQSPWPLSCLIFGNCLAAMLRHLRNSDLVRAHKHLLDVTMQKEGHSWEGCLWQSDSLCVCLGLYWFPVHPKRHLPCQSMILSLVSRLLLCCVCGDLLLYWVCIVWHRLWDWRS